MNQAEYPQSLSLGYYIDVVRRQWLVVALCGLLGLGMGVGYLYLVPARATASTLVSLNVITSDPFNPNRPASAVIDVASEAQVATSWAVAERAATELDVEPQVIRSSLDVTPVGDSPLLRISSTRGDPEQARDFADAIAATYLEYRSEQARSRIENTLTQSRTRLEPIRAELEQLNSILETAEPGSVEATQAEADRSLAVSELNSIFATTSSLQAIDTTAGDILNPASNNQVHWSPEARQLAVSGLVVGLGLGVLLTFLLNAVRPRIRTSRDVTTTTHAPLLGELHPGRHGKGQLFEGYDKAELQEVRERLLAEMGSTGPTGVYVVVECHDEDDGTELGLDLAWIMAQLHLQVVYASVSSTDEISALIERLRSGPSVAEGVGAPAKVYPTRAMTLSILDLPDSSDSGDGELLPYTLRNEIETLGQTGIVMINVPASAPASTRIALYGLAQGAVLVAASRKTTGDALGSAAQELAAHDAKALGTILLHAQRGRAKGHNSTKPSEPKDAPAHSRGQKRTPQPSSRS